ncbi:MAG: CRISPR-associated protein Cas5, partial [Candidatus Micrarchaeia archaeon]
MLGVRLELTGIFSFFRIPYNSLVMDTYLFPPKTTILGMVGAACGWDEKKVLESIKIFKYGVIIESCGEVFRETAVIYKTKNKPIYPITKNMIYRPAYTVFLYSENPKLIEEIEKAIRDPKFVLALGDSENLFYPKNL